MAERERLDDAEVRHALYAGFWARLGALVVDGLVLAPFAGCSEPVVMLLNRQRRAIHDFIGGTIVLQVGWGAPSTFESRGTRNT